MAGCGCRVARRVGVVVGDGFVVVVGVGCVVVVVVGLTVVVVVLVLVDVLVVVAGGGGVGGGAVTFTPVSLVIERAQIRPKICDEWPRLRSTFGPLYVP